MHCTTHDLHSTRYFEKYAWGPVPKIINASSTWFWKKLKDTKFKRTEYIMLSI